MTKKIEVINFSEFATIASCETKWGYAYMLGQQETGERAGLHLGTLLHVGGDRWFRGLGANLPDEWTDDINTGGKPGETRTLYLKDFDEELVSRAKWLLGRYEQHYGLQPPSSWKIISTEEWLTAELPGIGRLVGRTDGVFEDGQGRLWLREIKSAKQLKQRLLTVNIEPQPTLYYLLVAAKYGRSPHGIMYDGINTYRWKPEKPTQAQCIVDGIENQVYLTNARCDLAVASKKEQTEWARAAVERHPGIERPPAASFERVWPDRSSHQLAQSFKQLASAIRRRKVLIRDGIQYAIPNVGSTCNSCGFKQKCWANLQGMEEYEIAVEEDAELEWEE